jgi:hypothetical protein
MMDNCTAINARNSTPDYRQIFIFFLLYFVKVKGTGTPVDRCRDNCHNRQEWSKGPGPDATLPLYHKEESSTIRKTKSSCLTSTNIQSNQLQFERLYLAATLPLYHTEESLTIRKTRYSCHTTTIPHRGINHN